jgi:hypothetical protein
MISFRGQGLRENPTFGRVFGSCSAQRSHPLRAASVSLSFRTASVSDRSLTLAARKRALAALKRALAALRMRPTATETLVRNANHA